MERPPEARSRAATKTGAITPDAIREVAGELRRTNLIGTLHASAGDSEKYVYFSVGGVRLLSMGSRKYTSMGRLLVRRGKVSPADLQAALERQALGSSRLGDILIERKLCTKEDLEEMVRLQVENEVLDIVTWDDGIYRFHRGMPGDLFERRARATAASLDIGALLERLVSCAERYEKLRTKIPTLHLVFRLTPAGRAAAASPETAQSRRELLALVDGSRSLDQVAQAGEFGRFEALELAADALKGELLQPVGGAAPKAGGEQDEIAVLEAALQRALSDVLLRRKLAEAYERVGNVRKAVENYTKIAEDRLRQYQDDEAIAAFEKVTRLAPAEFGAHETLLECYLRTQKTPKAIEQGSRLGELYRANRLFNRARQVLVRVIGLAPRNVKLRTLLGDTNADLGDRVAAVKEYEVALGVLRDEKSDPGVLKTHCEKLLRLDAGNRTARRVLSKFGETAAPLAPLVRAVVIVLTLGATSLIVWNEWRVTVAYNDLSRRARGLLARGAFDDVLADTDDLRARFRVSFRSPALAAHARTLNQRRDQFAAQQLALALAEAEATAADPQTALERLQAAFGRTATAGVDPDLRFRVDQRLDQLRNHAGRRNLALDRLEKALRREPPDHSAAFEAAREAGAPPAAARVVGLPPIQVPVVSDPPGVDVFTRDGRLLGKTASDPERTVRVPVPIGGALIARVARPGYESVVAEVAWGDLKWPQPVTVEKEILWTYRLDGPPSAPPVATPAGLLVGSVGRRLHLLTDAGAHRAVWSLGLLGEVVGAPAGVSGIFLAATADGRLMGLALDGRERVAIALGEAPGSGPLVVGNRVVQPLASGDCWVWPLQALLDAAPGTAAGAVPEVQRLVVGEPPAGPPIAFEDAWVLVLGVRGRLVAFDLVTGTPRYDRALAGTPAGGLAVAEDGVCYAAFTDGRLDARYVTSGAAAWSQPDRIPGGAASGPVVAGATFVVVGSATDGAHAFDRRSGRRQGHYPAGGAAVRVPPLAVGDTIYLGDDRGHVWAFALEPGAGRRWDRQLAGPVSGGMVALAGAIVVTTGDGHVVAVRE